MKTRRRRRIRRLRPTFLLTVVVLAGLLALSGWLIWHGAQPRFMDVMIEVGDPMPPLSEFATDYADKNNLELVTPLEDIPLDRVGMYAITLRSGNKKETVNLTVRDTVAPIAVPQDVCVAPGTEVKASDFLKAVYDLSETEASFVMPLPALDTYKEVPVQILVRDAGGNEVVVNSMLYCSWLKPTYIFELGHYLRAEHLLLDPAATVLDQATIDFISTAGVNIYEISGEWNGVVRTCVVNVVDTTAPTLELQPVTIFGGQTATVEDFILSFKI